MARTKKQSRRRRARASRQVSLNFKTWGGCRDGAGRPKKKTSGVAHKRRPFHAERTPVHVTMKLRADVPRLRRRNRYKALREAFRRGKNKPGFRVVHFSVQDDHIHTIVEAKSRVALSRGIQGWNIRVARAINRACGRKGKVFADRYHEHALATPTETRNAICYVLHNGYKHGEHRGEQWRQPLDECSSAAYFDGWRELRGPPVAITGAAPVAAAQSWLLTQGWKRGRGGLISVYDVPAAARR
jgi:REP element-mobilizing transposase RayT